MIDPFLVFHGKFIVNILIMIVQRRKNKSFSIKSYGKKLAEGRGFEPLETCASADFKSAAFDHSASPPTAINYNEFW